MSSSEKFTSGLNKWAPTDKPMRVDFNRDNEIVDAFMQRATSGNMTLHVAPHGSDTEGNGSEGRPYRTIQRAVDSIPKMLLHMVTVKIAQGTYNERVGVHGFFGGGILTLKGGADAISAAGYKINGLFVVRCSSDIRVEGLEGTRAEINEQTFGVAVCPGTILFLNCRATLNETVEGSRAFSASQSPTVHCHYCINSGYEKGFWASDNARMTVAGCSDNSREYSYVAIYSGTISDNHSNTITDKITVHSGGMVIRNGQVIV